MVTANLVLRQLYIVCACGYLSIDLYTTQFPIIQSAAQTSRKFTSYVNNILYKMQELHFPLKEQSLNVSLLEAMMS